MSLRHFEELSYYFERLLRSICITETEKSQSRQQTPIYTSLRSGRSCVFFNHEDSYSNPKHTSKRYPSNDANTENSLEIRNLSSISKIYHDPGPEDSTSQKILTRLDLMIKEYEKPQIISAGDPASSSKHGSEISRLHKNSQDHSYSRSPARSYL